AATPRIIQRVDTIDHPAEGAFVTAGCCGKAGKNSGGGRGHLFHTPVLIKEENRHREALKKFINRQPLRPGKSLFFTHFFSPAKRWATQAYPPLRSTCKGSSSPPASS